jgi:DNA-binding transcriptional MerR regulator
MKELIRSGMVARILGVSPKTVIHWTNAGVLKPHTMTAGGQRLYDREVIEEFARAAMEKGENE